MGYENYFTALEKYDNFKSVADDFRKMIPSLEYRDIWLTGKNGHYGPTITDHAIEFSGGSGAGLRPFVLHSVGKSMMNHFIMSNEKVFYIKTQKLPYDLAVQIILIILAHYNNINVASDGEMSDWRTAVLLCEKILKYGSDFKLDK